MKQVNVFGSYFEILTSRKETGNFLKELKENGKFYSEMNGENVAETGYTMAENATLFVEYTTGDCVVYDETEDISKLKVSNVTQMVYSATWGDVCYNCDFQIDDYDLEHYGYITVRVATDKNEYGESYTIDELVKMENKTKQVEPETEEEEEKTMSAYKVTFKQSENVFCANIVKAEKLEDVEKKYSKYAWFEISNASEYDVAEAELRHMPIVTIEHETVENTESIQETNNLYIVDSETKERIKKEYICFELWGCSESPTEHGTLIGKSPIFEQILQACNGYLKQGKSVFMRGIRDVDGVSVMLL